jgi:putative aldouronate transport system permease protein
LLGGAINFIITVLMAYPLSKSAKLFPGRNVYMWFVIFCMLFSGGLIPWYMTIYSLGMLDSIWALVLPTAVPVFNVILLMNFFRGIPKELEEAANMDGAGPWKILTVIFIPISLPALATVTLFSIVGHWNAFFDGMILMHHKENWPLQTYIQQLIISVNSIMNTTDPEEIKRLTNMSSQLLNSAKVMVSMVPILLIYPFLQKYFVSGIVLGAVKE